MATQIRSKQPRPLSIIDESSHDDVLDICFQNETVTDSNELDKHPQHRPVRRISVAPLEHPAAAMTQGNQPFEEHSLRQNSANTGTVYTCGENKHRQNSNRTRDHLDCVSNFDDGVTIVHNVKAIQNKLFSKTGACCKDTQCAGDVVPTTDLPNKGIARLEMNISSEHGNKHAKFTDQQTNSQLDSRMSKNILNDLHKSDDKPKHLNGSERWTIERRKLCLEANLNSKSNLVSKCPDINNVTKEINNINNSNVEHQKLDEIETLSKGQQAWRNRVRKSSSFTLSSVKVRPLRRSMGSYDFEKSSFLHRNERSLKKGDNVSTENTDNTNVKFYLSSDVCEDQKAMFSIGHECRQQCNEQQHSREFSYCGSRSWEGLCSLPSDGSTEQSPNVRQLSNVGLSTRLHSLPNMGNILTNQTSQIINSQSGELSSDYPHYKTSKRTYSDTQSNSMLVRRKSAVDQSDLRSLQALATRLNLPTRRLSTTIWKEKYMGSCNNSKNVNLSKDCDNETESSEDDTNARSRRCEFLDDDSDNKERLHEQLGLVREDLIKMRLQDQALAGQFLKLRQQMLEMRLAVECQNYMELLDGAQEDIEEERELSRMVDIPSELLSPHYSLLHVGLTKMNFASRRFSTC